MEDFTITIQRYLIPNTPPTTPPRVLIDKFLQLKPNYKVRALLQAAIQRKIIDPNEAFLFYVRRLEDSTDAWAASIALRNGANPNMYVNLRDNYNMHILAYIYYNWRQRYENRFEDDRRLRATILSLIVMGSKPNLPAIDRFSGAVRDVYSNENLGNDVFQWLKANGINNDLSEMYPVITDKIDQATRRQTAIITGRVDGVKDKIMTEDEMGILLNARTEVQNFNYLPRPVKITGLDYVIIKDALLHFNTQVVEFYAAGGIYPSYPIINDILLHIRDYREEGQIFFEKMFTHYIIVAVRSGLIIDSEQLNLLLGIDQADYDLLISAYEKPYWVKACSHPYIYNDKIPKRLTTIARQVGLESTTDHASICTHLKKLSEVDPEKLKAAAVSRQKARMAADHGTLLEFGADGGIPILTCYNQHQLDKDAFDYTDLSMSHYRDDGGRIWCFDSTKYAFLYESKVNPNINQALPDTFVEEIGYKIKQLKKLGYDVRQPVQFSDIIKSITRNDSINDDETIRQYNIFLTYMAAFGITADDFDAFTIQQIHTVLKRAGFDNDINRLTKSHALYTLAYTVNGFKKSDKDRAKLIGQYLAQLKDNSPLYVESPRGIRVSEPPAVITQPQQIIQHQPTMVFTAAPSQIPPSIQASSSNSTAPIWTPAPPSTHYGVPMPGSATPPGWPAYQHLSGYGGQVPHVTPNSSSLHTQR